MPWRKITADQYHRMEDPEGSGWDEARFINPETGRYREIWDCLIDRHDGKIGICTALAHDIFVDPTYPIEVR
jgi:hypothetical protein